LIKNPILWDITPYYPLQVSRRFGGTFFISIFSVKEFFHIRNQPETGSNHFLHAGFLLRLFFDPEDGVGILVENVG
jgi:hypothetical protein